MSEYFGFLGKERVFNGPWQAFERAVARSLLHNGWEHVALIGGSGDNGGDIIASSGNKEVIYQVKYRRNGGAVGTEIVDDIKRAMEFYKINYGCVVTNGYLSPNAVSYINDLIKSGYHITKLEGKDILEFFKKLPTSAVKELEIREYQAIALNNIWKSFNKGSRSALLVLATGLGKTFVAGKFLSLLYKKYTDARVLILANKDDLIKQFDRAIWGHLPKFVSTHIWDEAEKPAFFEGVTLATFQSVFNHIKSNKELPSFNVVLIDECHHAGAETYQKVIDEINPDFLLGMTATPFRTDEVDITNLFGPAVFSMDIIKGMKHGFLTKVDYRIFADNVNWEFVTANSKKLLTISDLNKKLFLPQRDEQLISVIKSVWNFEKIKRGIIFCASIPHCQHMERILLSYGFKARALYAGMNPWAREQYLREFRQGKVHVLLAVDILNEGIDVPEVDLVVFLRVTHSRIIFLQQLGRGLRLSRHKNKVTVLDFVADIKRVASLFNLSDKDKKYKEDGVEVLNLNSFQVNFSDNTSETLMEAIIKDRFDIEDSDDNLELFLP